MSEIRAYTLYVGVIVTYRLTLTLSSYQVKETIYGK
jgi:hypothetical protein